MKVILRVLLVLLMPTFILSLTAGAAEYQEGKHYTKVSEKISSHPEVRVYFSFYSPHSFQFEPLMEIVKKQLPVHVKFERNHVDFLSSAPAKIQQVLSKALVVAQQLNMEKTIVDALYKRIHVQRQPIRSEKDIRSIFIQTGADGAKFDKLMMSFLVNGKARVMKKNQETMSNARALTSVPTVIINGKYRINDRALKKDGFAQDYRKLVSFLLALN